MGFPELTVLRSGFVGAYTSFAGTSNWTCLEVVSE